MIRAAIIFAAMAGPALGASCGPRDGIISSLEGRFSESRHASGLTSSSQLLEVFVNPETGGWTIITTTAGGLTCLLSSGTEFQAWEPSPVGDLG